MLKFLRSHIKLVIWVIVLSFIAWGAGTFTATRDEASRYAGSIGGKKVSYQEYLMTFRFYDLLSPAQEQQKQAAREAESSEKPEPVEEENTSAPAQMSADSTETTENQAAKPDESPAPPESSSFDQIRSLTWQTMVLSREAKKENIAVSDEEVRAEVQKLFSGAGVFDHVFYENWMRNNFRGRPRQFEEVVRHHLAAQKLRDHYLENIPEEEREGKWLAKLITLMSQADIKDYTVEQPTD